MLVSSIFYDSFVHVNAISGISFAGHIDGFIDGCQES